MATDTELERIPPQNIHAEQVVLGTMLLSKDAIADASLVLKGHDFYRPTHETIFHAILHLYGEGHPADPITVADHLERNGDLDRCGGAEYLYSLTSETPPHASAEYYARIVRDKARLRRLVLAGTKVAQLGFSQDGSDVDEIISTAQAEMYSATDNSDAEDYAVLGDLLDDALKELELIQQGGKAKGVPTGFRELDHLTHGLHPGQMIIVAARPAMGKSTLAMDFMRSASIKHKIPSVIFSLEMSRDEIITRLLAAESGVFMRKMREGSMTKEDWSRIATIVGRVNDAPLFIDDSPNMTIPEIRSKCRRLKQQHNLGLVVVDYLQLMTSGRQVESRQQEVSDFSRALKLLAKELALPVVAVAQLNRGPEARSDHRPMMSDLRESGSLEQDADVIMLLHRPSVYKEDDRPGEADLIIAKHRNGETATKQLAFQGHMARFTNLARE